VTVQKDKKYSCNLEGCKEKVNIRSLVLNQEIQGEGLILSSFLSVDVGQIWSNHVKSSCYFSFFLVLLLYFTSFLL